MGICTEEICNVPGGAWELKDRVFIGKEDFVELLTGMLQCVVFVIVRSYHRVK